MRTTILLLSLSLTFSSLMVAATSVTLVNTEIAENVNPQAKDPIVPPYRPHRSS